MTPTGSAADSARTSESDAGRARGPVWADAHLDLAYLAVNGRDMRAAVPADAPHALTLDALRAGGVRVTLKGARIAEEFQAIVEAYVRATYGGEPRAAQLDPERKTIAVKAIG